MKKTISFILTLALAVSLFGIASTPASAAVGDNIIVGGITYKILTESGTTGIVQVGNTLPSSPAVPTSTQGALNIPASVSYNGRSYTVTSIGDYAFSRCSSLTRITIPNSVTNIGAYVFGYCSSLESVTIPDSVTSIGNYAFANCNSLVSVTIPNSVTSIGDNTFSYCSSLASITIPNSVTTIGDSAFRDCSNLTSVTIPNSVTSIGVYAFYYCSGLESVTIPNSVTSIGIWAFNRCSSLTSVTIPDSVTSIGDYTFTRCSSLESVTIPDSVTSIGECAFYYCSSLESVTIPDSVTSIGSQAFAYCSSLTSVMIPDSVTSISGTFSNCSSLESVTIPDSVISIGGHAFSYCSSLASVTIPNSVTSIGVAAFYRCTALSQVWFDGDAPSVDDYAFSGFASFAVAHIHSYASGFPAEDQIWNNLIVKYRRVTPTLALTSPANSAAYTYPDNVTLTAELDGAYPDNSGKSVTFAVGSLNYTATTDASGIATYTITNPDAGSYTWSASYAGDTSNNAASTGNRAYTVGKTSPNLTLTAAANDTPACTASVTLTATLAGAYPSAANQPIIFTVNGADHFAVTDASGTAVFTVTDLTADSYTFIASYAGDANHNAAAADPINYYKVTFADWNGNVLKTQVVSSGSGVSAPANPTRTGYTFIGWDKDFSTITGPLTVTALYQINVYTVSFYKQSQDGNNGIAKTPYATQLVTYNEMIDWTKISAGKNAVWYVTDGKTYGAKFDLKAPITGDLKLAVKDQNNNQQ